MRRLFPSAVLLLTAVAGAPASAHPLGNFTVNQFTQVEVSSGEVHVRHVVDYAELPALAELRRADADGDGMPATAELNAFGDEAARGIAAGIAVTAGENRLPLRLLARRVSTVPGEAGLPTLRLECDLEAAFPAGGLPPRLRVENRNHSDRIGWREMVAVPRGAVALFDSTAFADSLTDELRAYPADSLPLDERAMEFSLSAAGPPPGAVPPRTRAGGPAAPNPDRLAGLVTVPELTPLVALFGCLLAFGMGALHALSPGHGKTVVGAYLVGARGTARHALFLGVTVTLTHTAGVFALGLATLFLSRSFLPERLYPVLSFVSGAAILAVGVQLFVQRLRKVLGEPGHSHERTAPISGEEEHDHDHEHGHGHSHLPPGADGSAVSWRSLLALGVSGGLLPCPSALVVLLSATGLGRAAYGLLLVFCFSLGLATTLTAVGLLFVVAGRFMTRRSRFGPIARFLPLAGAFGVAGAGLAICGNAFAQASAPAATAATAALPVLAILGAGLFLGLQHALEADHLAAVSTIVTERRNPFSSAIVGGLWGVGHTLSLLVVGAAVILLNVRITGKAALALEFGVALMLMGLGLNVLWKLARGGRLHVHAHVHGDHVHLHPHVHEAAAVAHEHGEAAEPAAHSHHGFRIGSRPLWVGMVHGLAGSAALMLLVLAQIRTPGLALAYIALFGLGSIGGMMAMSALVGLPLHFTANRFERAHLGVRALSGLFSLAIGVHLFYEIGFVEGLFR